MSREIFGLNAQTRYTRGATVGAGIRIAAVERGRGSFVWRKQTEFLEEAISVGRASGSRIDRRGGGGEMERGSSRGDVQK